MAYNAKVIEIMIASPADVAQERDIVRKVVSEWNYINTRDKKIVLVATGWETHTVPDLAGRPQQIIIDQLLDHADILVGIFWNKLGSPTGTELSGTVEEIKVQYRKSKPIMVYFSDAAIRPSEMVGEQYKQVQEFKDWVKNKGLYESYESISIFEANFRRHLALRVSSFLAQFKSLTTTVADLPLSEEAMLLLKTASMDSGRSIMHKKFIGEESISSNGITFTDGSARSIARWESAKNELISKGLSSIVNNNVSNLTQAGYVLVDQISKK